MFSDRELAADGLTDKSNSEILTFSTFASFFRLAGSGRFRPDSHFAIRGWSTSIARANSSWVSNPAARRRLRIF